MEAGFERIELRPQEEQAVDDPDPEYLLRFEDGAERSVETGQGDDRTAGEGDAAAVCR